MREQRSGRTQGGIHNRLAALRAERGLSRAELAAAVSINVQTVGFLERGDYGPSVELALRIAEFLGLPVEAVFSLREFDPMSSMLYRSTSGRDQR